LVAGREMLGARIDPDLKRLVDADPRDNQDIVSAALWDEFGGQRQSSIEKRIEHKDRRIMQIKKEINDLQGELEAVQNEKASLERQLEKMQSASEAYRDDLDAILDNREDGERDAVIIPETLGDVADRHGKSPERVYEDLKSRAVGQERRLRASDFVPNTKDPDEPGWVTDVWGDDE
jgi:DNA repair exonuclease SbcCD ATPase subunit